MPRNDNKPWSHQENLVVFNLYGKIPFGKMHRSNSEICTLASVLGRTPSSIAMRLVNFAAMDPSLSERGIKGLSSVSQSVKDIWAEFLMNPEQVAFMGEAALAEVLGKGIEEVAEIDLDDVPKEGVERDAIVKIRVNQSLFRKRILSAYDFCCCVTGMNVPELLVASHIVPWARDSQNRLNPRNGLCLNPLHDRAFDRGLIWIDEDLIVRSSPILKNKATGKNSCNDWLMKHEGQSLTLPRGFSPDVKLLAWHRENIARI